MRTQEQLVERLRCYGAPEYIYDPDCGLIAWHWSTGENLELLFIEAVEIRCGHGTDLLRRMIRRLVGKGECPYHSVFGFRLAANGAAEGFYRSLGWTQVNLGHSIYGGDDTVIMWIAWDELRARLGV